MAPSKFAPVFLGDMAVLEVLFFGLSLGFGKVFSGGYGDFICYTGPFLYRSYVSKDEEYADRYYL